MNHFLVAERFFSVSQLNSLTIRLEETIDVEQLVN
jgi:hypothetical protein